MIEILSRGWGVIKQNSKLWLILLLLVVFPAVYLYSFQSVQDVTYKNLETIELQQIQGLQNLIESLVLSEVGINNNLLDKIFTESDNVKTIQIVTEKDNRLFVTYAQNPDLIDSEVTNPAPYRSALIKPGETFTYNYKIGENFILQSFRSVIFDNKVYYIFTEHDFQNLRNRIDNRILDSYVYIVIIFAFLLFLAYWLSKQINFERLYLKAKQEMNERDLFTNSLAHELRAPLTAMRGYASMIEESPAVPSSEREYAKRINQSSTRLVTLVSDFLEAARIQSGKLNIKIEKTDLEKVVNNVIKASESLAKNKGLELGVKLSEQGVEIDTDAHRLEQILTNLLSNSIKYTDRGSVTLKLENIVDKVVITIADTGGGISADDQKKLFQPFMRVGDSQTQNSVTGTGLGMWITKKLVTELGGTIGLESIKNVGTHVVLIFPHKKA